MSEENPNLEVIGSEINSKALEEGLETINLNEVRRNYFIKCAYEIQIMHSEIAGFF